MGIYSKLLFFSDNVKKIPMKSLFDNGYFCVDYDMIEKYKNEYFDENDDSEIFEHICDVGHYDVKTFLDLADNDCMRLWGYLDEKVYDNWKFFLQQICELNKELWCSVHFRCSDHNILYHFDYNSVKDEMTLYLLDEDRILLNMNDQNAVKTLIKMKQTLWTHELVEEDGNIREYASFNIDNYKNLLKIFNGTLKLVDSDDKQLYCNMFSVYTKR